MSEEVRSIDGVGDQVIDVWRLAVIVAGTVLAAFSAIVVVRYLILARQGVAQHSPHRGHVVTIATSYVLLAGVSAGEQVARLGLPLSWRLPLVTVALALGAYALAVVWRHLR